MTQTQSHNVVLPQDVEQAYRSVRALGQAEALRRLKEVEPTLGEAVTTFVIDATEHLRRSGMLDDIEDNIRDKAMLAVLAAAECLRAAHHRRWLDANPGPPLGAETGTPSE